VSELSFASECEILAGMLRRIVIALVLATWFIPPPARADTPVAGQQQSDRPGGAREPAGDLGSAAEAQSLAERERQAPDLENFEGGGRISMTTTTLIIILLLVIVIILIL
jgi:hypothetical protein